MTQAHATAPGDPAPDIADAAGRLRHLGFLLVSPFPPGAAPSELLVSVHRHPTIQHFDVELARYWETGHDRRGHPQELDFGSPMPQSGSFAWGKIELIDRFGVENDFVTLGGEMEADRVGDEELVAVFRSSAPILRMGGHSQAADVVALELAAFFARMMVPIDFDPGVEQALANADPLARYAAFVEYESDRYRSHLLLREEHPAQAEILSEEADRLRRTHPDAWARGQRLLGRLELHG